MKQGKAGKTSHFSSLMDICGVGTRISKNRKGWVVLPGDIVEDDSGFLSIH